MTPSSSLNLRPMLKAHLRSLRAQADAKFTLHPLLLTLSAQLFLAFSSCTPITPSEPPASNSY